MRNFPNKGTSRVAQEVANYIRIISLAWRLNFLVAKVADYFSRHLQRRQTILPNIPNMDVWGESMAIKKPTVTIFSDAILSQ